MTKASMTYPLLYFTWRISTGRYAYQVSPDSPVQFLINCVEDYIQNGID